MNLIIEFVLLSLAGAAGFLVGAGLVTLLLRHFVTKE